MNDAMLLLPESQRGAMIAKMTESPSVSSLVELVRSSSATSLVDLLHSYSATNLVSLAQGLGSEGGAHSPARDSGLRPCRVLGA